MIKEWCFKLDEKAIINDNAFHGLPSNIGDLITVTEILLSPTYDYRVRLPDGTNTKVKEKELTKIDQNDRILDFKIGDEITYTPMNEKVKIVKIDYLLRHIEIEHLDGSMQVVIDRFLKKEGVTCH